MFAVEIPRSYFYARFSKAATPMTTSMTMTSLQQHADGVSPQQRILNALAEMLPSTVSEIAEAIGLDVTETNQRLDELLMRYRIMFNPLTKRYSLPKTSTAGLAA